jgi:tetratricopeptide (TPR) repeat protein
VSSQARTAQVALAAHESRQAVQHTGIQFNNFIGSLQARSVAATAPPIAVPQRRIQGVGLRGRRKIVDHLDSVLRSATDGSIRPEQRVVVLHGLGGVGKTALALEVAHRALEKGGLAWWVSGASRDQMVAALHAVAFEAGALDAEFDHAHPADVLWRNLNSLERFWLLVIDNIDVPGLLADGGRDLRDGIDWLRLPSVDRGLVVLTSRDGRTEEWAPWIQLLPVKPLDSVAGGDLLLDIAPAAGSEAAARRLAKTLGGLPLAIDLVGQYLREASTYLLPSAGTVTTFDSYRMTFKQRFLEMSMDADDRTGDSSRRALSTTWEISLDQLAAQGHDLARPLLRLLSCCAPGPLPYRAVLRSEILVLCQLFTDPTPRRIDRSLKALSGLGLIQFEIWKPGGSRGQRRSGGGVQSLVMHPLVHATTRQNTETSGNFATYRHVLSDLLDAATADIIPENADHWDIWSMLAEHVFELLEASAEYADNGEEVRRGSELARRVAWYQYMAGLYMQSGKNFKRILDLLYPVAEPGDAAVLTIRGEFARAIREGGNADEARREFESILAVASNQLGPDHPETIRIRIGLGRTLREMGDALGSQRELEIALEAANRVLGAEHPDALLARLNLAVALRKQEIFDRAAREYQTTLDGWQRRFGNSDLTTLDIQYEMAEMARERGDVDAALAVLNRILPIVDRVYGKSHYNALIIRRGLAVTFVSGGRLDEARQQLSELVRIGRGRLGGGHPFTRQVEEELVRLGVNG